MDGPPPSLARASMSTAFSLGAGGSGYSLSHQTLHNQLLKEDDDLLRQTFLQIFRHHHPALANKVDVIFALAQVGGERPSRPWAAAGLWPLYLQRAGYCPPHVHMPLGSEVIKRCPCPASHSAVCSLGA